MIGFIIRLLVIFSLCVYSTFAIEESFCAGTGYSNDTIKRLGLRSMGYSHAYLHPLSTIWAANHAKASKMENGLIIELFIVQQQVLPSGSSEQLNGWLRLKLSLPASTYFKALAVWALTDTRESIGEFVNLTGSGCDNWEYAEEFLPCSAAPIDATKTPNMFVYTHKKNKANEVNLLWRMSSTYCNKPKKFQFLAATNSKLYNQNPPSYPEFHLEDGRNKELGPYVYTTDWLKPKFYGAAAQVYQKSTMTCKSSIHKVQSVWLRNKPSTVPPATMAVTLDPKWEGDRWKSDGSENSITVIKRATCKADVDRFITFGGRCTQKVNDQKRAFATLSTPPACNHVPGNFEPEDQQQFQGEYADKRAEWEQQILKNCECPPIPTAAEVKNVSNNGGVIRIVRKRSTSSQQDNNSTQNYTTRKINNPTPSTFINLSSTEDYDEYEDLHLRATLTKKDDDTAMGCAKIENFSKYNEQGICVDTTAGKIVYGVRQWHAVSTLFCTLVLVPIASYMARYHKGPITTIGAGKPYIPIKMWYIFHILIVLPILCLYISGLVTIRVQRILLGYSYNVYAKFHRYIGIALLVLIILQVLTGFLRPQNISCRKVAIWAHFVTGVTINYGGLVICILTYKIPASPTSFQPHLFPRQFNPMRKHIAPMILTFWGVVDISFNIFMTVHVVNFDKMLGIRRAYFPVIFPALMDKRMLVDEAYEREVSFQKMALSAYAICCVLIYFVTCLSIYHLNDEHRQSYGPMYCTHDNNGRFFDPADGENGKVDSMPDYCHVNAGVAV